jgi:Ca2+-binding EF-hand superfamily protein
MGYFTAVDRDRSGHIDDSELMQALSSAGMNFGREASRLMIKMFDRTGDGKIGFDEFQQLHGYITSMQDAFRQCDKDNSGHLSAQEVYRAVSSSGYNLSQQTFDYLFKKFDRNRRGNLTLDGYIELCCFLGTARNVYAAYDTQRVGSVQFNFDQFLFATSKINA